MVQSPSPVWCSDVRAIYCNVLCTIIRACSRFVQYPFCVRHSCVGATFVVSHASSSWRIIEIVYKPRLFHQHLRGVTVGRCKPSAATFLLQLDPRQLRTRMREITGILCRYRRFRPGRFCAVEVLGLSSTDFPHLGLIGGVVLPHHGSLWTCLLCIHKAL